MLKLRRLILKPLWWNNDFSNFVAAPPVGALSGRAAAAGSTQLEIRTVVQQELNHLRLAAIHGFVERP